MAVTFKNASAGTILPGGAVVRVTFDRSLVGYAVSQPSEAYRKLQNNLPGMGLGYLTSPFVNVPGASDFTVDWRTGLATVLPAGNLVAAANEAVGVGYNVGRFELLALKSTGPLAPAANSGQSAAAGSEARVTLTNASDAQPTWFDKLVAYLASSLKVTAYIMAGLLLLALVAVAIYFLH